MKALGILAAASLCAAAGFFLCAIFASKTIAEWRDRLTRLRARAIQAGLEIPPYAQYEDGRMIVGKDPPCVKRGRMRLPALIFLLILAAGEATMACAFAILGKPISPSGALFWGGAFGIQSAIGSAALWSAWPIRRPTVTQEFIRRWVEQFPMQSPNDPGFDPGQAEDRATDYVGTLVAAMDCKIEQPQPRR